jgi:hypothetical protein
MFSSARGQTLIRAGSSRIAGQRWRSGIEPWLVAAGAIAAAGMYAWLARFGIDLTDEGYFMDLALRVMHGQLPYRDFDTYYTPGLFYLDAATFAVAGVSVPSARLLMIVMRVACGVVLYRLTRRVAAWPFAVLPPLFLLAADLSIESHPAWPALLGTLLMLESLACHQARVGGRTRTEATGEGRLVWGVWLGLAGAAAAAAFAFKQNVGAFAILGGVGYVVLRPRSTTGRLVLWLRLAYVGVLALVVRRFLDNGFDERLAVTVWLPLLATLVLLLAWSGGYGRRMARLPMLAGFDGVVLESAWFGAGVVIFSLGWLGPLLAALGPGNTPLGLFLGDANQAALIFPLDGLPLGTPMLALVAAWLPLVAAAVFRGIGRWLLAPAALASVASALPRFAPLRTAPLDPLTSGVGAQPGLEWLDLQFGSLSLYLAALAAWLAWLILVRRRAAGRPPPIVAWYLLVGTLAQLALYPRADRVHALFAAGPLLAVGAWIVARIHRHLAARLPRPGQAAVFVALLVVPLVAVAPYAYWRYSNLMPRPSYVKLELDGAPELVSQPLADDLRDAIRYVQRGTPPGAPFFAYPVDPLANVLADRPNPTRFDHFMPGALTATDMQQVIAGLDQARPRYVLWDHGAVVYWDTDRANRPLSDYIWRCYQQVATFHLLLILERTGC